MKNKKYIFKSRVSKVHLGTPDGTQKPTIFITPIPYLGGHLDEYPAHPPSGVPTSYWGSGAFTMPDIGQECITTQIGDEYYILAYVTSQGVSTYGAPDTITEDITPGSLIFSMAGVDKTSLILTRQSYASLNSHGLAHFSLWGDQKKIIAKGQIAYWDYAGGFLRSDWDKESKLTQIRHLFTKSEEYLAFSDITFRQEQGRKHPVPDPAYRYADKVLLKYGHIPGEKVNYHLQTSQAVSALTPQDRNVVTNTRIGYQEAFNKFSNSPDEHVEGILHDFEAKQNIRGNVATFKQSLGKVESGRWKDRFSVKEYRVGLNNGLPFGAPITDPLGEGKGWTEDAEQIFIEYIGQISSRNAYLKKYISTPALGGDRLSEAYFLGGDEILRHEVEDGKHTLSRVYQKSGLIDLVDMDGEKLKKELTSEGYELRTILDEMEDKIFLGKNKIRLENHHGSYVELKEDVITVHMDDTIVELSPGKVLIHAAKDGASGIKLQMENSKLYLGNSTAEIVDILSETLNNLSTDQTPGYGAPLVKAPMYAQLLAKINTIK